MTKYNVLVRVIVAVEADSPEDARKRARSYVFGMDVEVYPFDDEPTDVLESEEQD